MISFGKKRSNNQENATQPEPRETIRVSIGNSVLSEAKRFLTQNIEAKRFVVRSDEIPRRVREYLVENGFLYSPCKGLGIIKPSNVSDREVLDQNLFKLLDFVGRDCIFSGELALNHHTGVHRILPTYEAISQTKNTDVCLGSKNGYVVEIRKSDAYREAEAVTISGGKVHMETAQSYLINRFPADSSPNSDFSNLALNTDFSLPDAERFVSNGCNISKLSRLALWYKQNGNIRNYSVIKSAVAKLGKSLNYSSPSASQKPTSTLSSNKKEEKSGKAGSTLFDLNNLFGSSLSGNSNAAASPENHANPKIARFKATVEKFDTDIDNVLRSSSLRGIGNQSLDSILSEIDANKVYDTYHSLTIEEYNVSMKDISILSNPNSKKYEKIENTLVIKSYFNAFNTLVRQIKADFPSPSTIRPEFIQDIANLLFSEFARAKKIELPRSFRKTNVRISGTTHIPPDAVMVPEYMDVFLGHLKKISNGSTENIVKKAILTHFFIAYIHPFEDGNGRTARFLMNYFLGTGGIGWVTVNSNEKDRYISCLKKASENGDIRSFAEYILEKLRSK